MSSPISGFTAIPNPQMLAFMGAQSFIMMYQAGEGWQYGKRKISAMSNEEFNKLTPQMVLEKQAIVLRQALPTIQKSMNDMTPMIATIVHQYGDYIDKIIEQLPHLTSQVTSTSNIAGLIQALQNISPSVPGTLIQQLIIALQNLTPEQVSGLPGADASPYVPPFSGGGDSSSQLQNKQNAYLNALKSMTKLQLIKEANEFFKKGFSSTFINSVVRPLWEELMAEMQPNPTTLPPPSATTLPPSNVSAQTLRLERTRLINAIKSEERVLRDAKAKMNANPALTHWRVAYEKQLKVLAKIKQELADFLFRWKDRHY